MRSQSPHVCHSWPKSDYYHDDQCLPLSIACFPCATTTVCVCMCVCVCVCARASVQVTELAWTGSRFGSLILYVCVRVSSCASDTASFTIFNPRRPVPED